MSHRKALAASIGINGLIVVFETIALVMSIREHGVGMFQYYTQDSNYLALGSSVIYTIFAVRKFAGKQEIPEWVATIRYMASCCLLLTFTVVLFVLIPMSGFQYAGKMLLQGAMLYHHLLCPVLSAASFLLFERGFSASRKTILAAMAPTVVYALIIIALNIAKLLRGPYPFLYVYEQPVWMSFMWACIILSIALLFSWLLWRAKRKAQT